MSSFGFTQIFNSLLHFSTANIFLLSVVPAFVGSSVTGPTVFGAPGVFKPPGSDSRIKFVSLFKFTSLI